MKTRKDGVYIDSSGSYSGHVFDLELYQDDRLVEKTTFRNFKSDGTPGGSYYLNKISMELSSLPINNYSKARSFYYEKSSYLKSEQSLLDREIEKETAKKDAEMERSREEELKRKEYVRKQEHKLWHAKTYGSSEDAAHYQRKIDDLDDNKGCSLS